MKLFRISLIFLFCLGLVSGYAQEDQAEQKEFQGRVVGVELGTSRDPQNPDFWPCLLSDNQQIMLLGNSDILEELYYLIGREVTLKAEALPKQKIGENEFEACEVIDIETVDARHYLSAQKAPEEFRQALQKHNILDETVWQKMEGRLQSIWFDKNENGQIDAGDRLFVTSESIGRNNGRKIIYPSQAVIRQYHDGIVSYDTFIYLDPFPVNSESAVLGTLKYDAQKNTYSVSTDKLYKNGEGSLRAPTDEEKDIVVEKNELLKPFIGKKVFLVGDQYDTLVWQGDNLPEISRKEGQYLVKAKGKVSLLKTPSQKPWELTLAILQDAQGQKYELRQVGDVNFWKNFSNKELSISGALKPVTSIEGEFTPVLEVFSVDYYSPKENGGKVGDSVKRDKS